MKTGKLRMLLELNGRFFGTKQRRGMSGLVRKPEFSGIVIAGVVLLCTCLLSLQVAEAVQPDIVAGQEHSVALKSDGTVWAWGNNTLGQLGNCTDQDPVKVTGLENVKAITAGDYWTMALKNDGTVWEWGDANSTSGYFCSPIKVSGLNDVKAIDGGYYHAIALKNDGTVWTWGTNYNGQLGDGTTTHRKVPMPVPGLDNVSAISAGTFSSFALKGDGTVWAWGHNGDGQLGDGTTDKRLSPKLITGLSDVRAIAGSYEHTVALKNDGTVWTWGNNYYGQLGDGTKVPSYTPVMIPGISNVEAISSGNSNNFTLVLKDDGTVWGWGGNGAGQLGNGNYDEQLTPVAVTGLTDVIAFSTGSVHSLALKKDGTAWAWGYNGQGRLGGGWDAPSNSNMPLQVVNFSAGIAVSEPLSPVNGAIVDAWPEFVWTHSDAVQYEIDICRGSCESPAGIPLWGAVLDSASACDSVTGTCSYIEMGLDMTNYAWRIRAKASSSAEWENWLPERTFSVSSAFAKAPHDSIISDPTPTYHWQMIGQRSDRFWLSVMGTTKADLGLGADGEIHGDLLVDELVEVAGHCSGELCSFTPATALLNGDYVFWQVQESEFGRGAMSNLGLFTVLQPEMLQQPVGNVPKSQELTFRWREVYRMNAYDITVKNSAGEAVLAETVSAAIPGSAGESICNNGICEYTVAFPLGIGNYTWALLPKFVESGVGGAVTTWLDGKDAAQAAELTQALEASFQWGGLSVGLHQETEINIQYSGDWQILNSAGLGEPAGVNGGTLTYTTDPAATAEFWFEGAGVVIYRSQGPDYGDMEVCVDNAPCQVVENHAGQEVLNVPYLVDGLGEGLHHVTIRNLSNLRIDLDAVQVLDNTSEVGSMTEILPMGGDAVALENTASALFPSEAVSSPVIVSVSKVADPSGVLPNPGYTLVGDVYEFLAATLTGEPVTHFDKDLTISLSYASGNVGASLETELIVSYYDETSGVWNSLPSIVSTTQKTVSAFSDHFTKFAIFAPAAGPVPTPVPTVGPVPTPVPTTNPPAVPEPGTLMLLLAGLCGLAGLLRKRTRK